MPGRRPKHPPRHWSISGEWPNAPLREGAPPSAALARGVASRLQRALEHNRANSRGPGSARKAAAATGLSITTITNILRGISWPDIDTVARLEKALDASLWGDEHLTGTRNSN
ncbi:helix-turn-helix domain-containing protein [Candidatus Poriferisocius sp.]|uniref:helix-turn-helix domain-containing protein n=1 Tax=Candidatus Poriferisocius sp. TaxID=3101276 RepID=UPI003B0194DA